LVYGSSLSLSDNDSSRVALQLRRQQLTLNTTILRQEAERLKGSSDAASLLALVQRMMQHHEDLDAYASALEALATAVRAMP